MYCRQCGAANPDGPEIRFCRVCGSSLASSNGAVAAKARPVIPAVAAARPGAAYGGFWIRTAALVVDSIVVGLIALVLQPTLQVTAGLIPFQEAEDPWVAATVSLLVMMLTSAYLIAMPAVVGATPGKLLFGYHLVDAHSRHIGYGRSFVRTLSQLLSFSVLGLGFIWVAFDPCKQGWHDKLAGTFVVRKEDVKGQDASVEPARVARRRTHPPARRAAATGRRVRRRFKTADRSAALQVD